MKSLFANARLSASLLVPFWLLIFILFSQFATAQATVTYTTETLPAGNIPQDATSLIYALKVVVHSESPVVIRSVSIKTSGNYTRSDVNKFLLLHGPDASVENATAVGEILTAYNGGGETLTWTSGEGANTAIRLGANSTNYLFVQARTTLTATGGRTIGIRGINNALSIEYSSPVPNPVSINNQSDKAGLQTILAPSVTYSTEPVTGGSALAGTAGHLVYILKVKGGGVGTAQFNNVSVKTTGMYSASDMENFLIYRNTSASLDGATFLGFDENLTGAGETLNFTVPLESIPTNETRYYLITAKVSAGASDGRTFGINGAGNALNIGYINEPTITNNQTDAAALKTIIGPPIYVSTIQRPAGNAVLGSSDHVLYVFQISTNPYTDVTISDIALRIKGTYTTSDISSFRLFRSPVSTMDPGSIESVSPGSVVTGNGELVSFSGSQILKSGTTTYFGVVADVDPNATPGRTFGVDGSNNDFAISFGPDSAIPSVEDNQTNISGMQTVFAYAVTYSTVPIAAQSVLRGTELYPIYILKVTNGNTLASASTVTIKTTGTYSGSDISSFRLFRSNSPNMSSQSVEAASPDVPATGGGETLTFSMPTALQPNATKYYGIMANVSSNATIGRTFGIDGSANALDINFSSPSASLGIIDNQTDVAGIQTVFAHSLTYSTVPIAAQNVLRGATSHPVYILKVTNGDARAGSRTVTIKTTGTYSGSDISSFRLVRGPDPSLSSQTTEAASPPVSATGGGETLTFTIQTTLQPNEVQYYGIMANVSLNATPGRTFGIDGSANALNIDFFTQSSTLKIIDNQTNEAGLQTVFADDITYSTVPLAAQNVLKGTTIHPVYILKVTNGNARALSSTVRIKTTGTYSDSDITGFRLFRGPKPDMTSTEAASEPVSATGGGETLTFPMRTNLQPNEVQYYGIMANVSSNATTGRTFGIDGSANALDIDFVTVSSTLNKINNQTNQAGLQTIGVSGITYSTEPLPAGTVALGTLDHPVYTLKVTLNGDAGATLTNLETTTSGTYQAGDVSSFNLYQSDKPTLDNGAENVRVLGAPIATIDASAGAGEILRFGTGQIWLPAAGTTYLIITANISASGRNAKTVHINGNSSPATLQFSGAAPSPVTNNQSNAAGEQRIDNGLPVTLVSFKAKSEGNERQLVWETSMEKDNDYFEIQRSTDAINFVAIGQIKGSAAGFEMHHYNFTDSEAIAESMIYYRLKMVDLDQTFAYSRIASVQMKGLDNALIYPNPSSDMLYLNVKDWTTVSMVRLFDLNGKIMYQSDKIPAKTIAVKKFPVGSYVVSITDQSGSTTSQRVLLVR